jgi:hypothetical protein
MPGSWGHTHILKASHAFPSLFAAVVAFDAAIRDWGRRPPPQADRQQGPGTADGHAGADGPGLLKNGETFAHLGAGFGVGTTTAWRYVNETVTLLSARSPKLDRALAKARKDGLLYLVMDGTHSYRSTG